MNAFNVNEIGDITQKFILTDRHLNYQPNVIEMDEKHVLIQAESRFSSLFCQITGDIELIRAWSALQNELYSKSKNKINRYLVYIIPEVIVKDHNLYQELSRAESNEFFFRKVFIDLPEDYDQKIIEGSLSKRIPIWMADRESILREYVPLIRSIIPNTVLRRLLVSKNSSEIVEALEKDRRYRRFFKNGEEIASLPQDMLDSPMTIDTTGDFTRIDSLQLHNFRYFKELNLNLSCDIVVIFGKNGMGKTTIVDAIEFAIFNSIERLQYDPDLKTTRSSKYQALINSASPQNAEARISLNLSSRDHKNEILTIIHKDKSKILLDGKKANKQNIITMLTGNDELARKKEYLDILLHTHFLGQHSIRHFIYGSEGDKSENVTQNRYDLIIDMFGFGEINSLKRKMQNVFREIMEKKINPINNLIKEQQANLRRIQHKYGPKIRNEIEKKGYTTELDVAVNTYRRSLKSLQTRLRIELDSTIVDCELPPYNFQKACQYIKHQLNEELDDIKSKDSDLNRLNALQMKINSVLSNAGIQIESDNFIEYVPKVRAFLKENILIVEGNLKEYRLAKQKVSKLGENQAILKDFHINYKEYKRLKSREHLLSIKLEETRKRNDWLIKQKDLIESEIRQTEKSLQRLNEEIKDVKQRINILIGLLRKYNEIESKRLQIAKNHRKIAELQKQISKSIVSLPLAEKKNRIPTTKLIRDILDKNNHFSFNNQFICPCCGMIYERKKELNNQIRKQLRYGQYKEDLLEFILRVDQSHKHMAAEAVEELNKLKRKEQLSIEKENITLLKEIEDYEELTTMVTGERKISREQLFIHKKRIQSKYVVLIKQLQQSNLKSLKHQLKIIEEELRTLGLISYEQSLRRIKTRLLKIMGPVERLLTKQELNSPSFVTKKISILKSELIDYRKKMNILDNEIKSRAALTERFEEISNNLIELESILNKYDSSDDIFMKSRTSISQLSKAKQQPLYEELGIFNDLEKLFGCLNTEDESARIRLEIDKHKNKKDEWTVCYNKIREIAENLATASHSGLEKSLKLFSPLINEIFKKFTRHEYFSEVQLKTQVTPKLGKRNLYILLKNYSNRNNFTPSSYLSEAQLNILALSIFLTRVIHQNMSIFQTVLIDDPIQQMDDMNATAFIDIIMGLSQVGKQIVITTCDADFFTLICQKMSQLPLEVGITFKSIDLQSELYSQIK